MKITDFINFYVVGHFWQPTVHSVYINFFEKMFENELRIKYMELLYGIYKNI
jgi:hypothetical protein